MNDLIVMDLLILNGAVSPVFKPSKGTNCQKHPIASRDAETEWEEVDSSNVIVFLLTT